MAKRTIRHGIATYRHKDGYITHGFAGEEVDVHKEDVDRFDRLVAEDFPEPEAPEATAVATVEPDFPEGEPSEEWTGKQLDAYGASKGVDVTKQKTKAEKVAALAAPASADPAGDQTA